ncbi:hypothetical protein [Enterovirga rhinocerotis]|nr:hypothetical protein [Enterovirga rhinocerotis]
MSDLIFRRMPATHLLRACLLAVGLLSILLVQVQDAVAFGTSVVRDCPGDCGFKAKTSRSDAVRPAAVAPSSAQHLPDDGYVPIRSLAPELGASERIMLRSAHPIVYKSFSPALLDRPPRRI